MNTYEAMMLLDNREVKKGWDSLKEAIDSVFKKHGAEIVVAKRWDERKLAYEIRKQRRATYYLSYFKADAGAIDPIRRALGLTAPVLRHLILTCEEIPAEAYDPEREFDLDRAEGEGEGDKDDEESEGTSDEAPAEDEDTEIEVFDEDEDASGKPPAPKPRPESTETE